MPLEFSSLPGKLPIARSAIPALCEIYLVEGRAPAGSAKQGRDRRTQAILPLKGKILNRREGPLRQDARARATFKTMITALGTEGSAKRTTNIAKLRYHKIIIMTATPDVHGSHIRTCCLDHLSSARCRRLIEPRPPLHAAQPPLYKVKKG